MNKAKQNYKSKCKKREVVFYIKDNNLYEFSKTINFQKFVKDALRIYERKLTQKVYEILKEGDNNGKNGNI